VLEALPRLAPVLLRHLVAYGDLLAEETDGALRQWRRRAIGLAVASVAGAMALLLGCAWIIAANWDGPHRLLAPALLCLGFLLLALAAWAWTQAAAAVPPPFARLRAELRRDRELIASLEGEPLRREEVPQVRYGG
jgi:uncharacterized membrane protein YqjE